MKLRAARAAAGAMGGRKRVRARCVRMPKASMQRVHVSIYSFPPLSPPFSQVLLSFHQHRKKALSDVWTVLVELLVRLLVAFPTAA